MKIIALGLLILMNILFVTAQDSVDEIKLFQQELNESYSNPDDSPLEKKQAKRFKGHDFFPINLKYRVEAKFVRTENSEPIQMKTSTDRLPTYSQYGIAYFEIDGVSYQLSLYQNHSSRDKADYNGNLFLPFGDLTNGETSYGGGRYIDVFIPEGETIIIDFNKAYNPYCAYSYRYSCPIPPLENMLEIKIEAGVRMD